MKLATLILLLAFIEGSRSLSDIYISNLDQSTGIAINSLASADLLAYSLRNAGDFNGDGYDDVIIGSLGAKNTNGAGVGAVYIIFGSKDGLSDLTVPSGLGASKGLIIKGSNSGERFGYSVSFAGDVNNDKIDDIIIGSDQSNAGKGSAYVIYGSNNPPAIIDLAQGGLNLSQGFTIIGFSSNDYLGSSVSWAGDVNNDGIDDIIVGANGVSSAKGAAYVIFGKEGSRGNITPGSGLGPAEGFAILGTGTDNLGYSVSNAGDVDGDGIGDVIIAAYGQNSFTGAVYIIFGKDGKTSTFATIDLSQPLSASQGFFVKGNSQGSLFGGSVGSAGDFNGDGKSDVIVGAYTENAPEGAVYVIFGGTLSDMDLSLGLDPARVMKIKGASPADYLGKSVSGAGDINGDGIDDIIMGAPQGSLSAGTCYVIFGDQNLEPEIALDAAGLDPMKGFRIIGATAGGILGNTASSAGDVNGDGMNDLIVGSYTINQAAGAAYILFTPVVCPETCVTCSTRFKCGGCKTGYGLYNSQCVICPTPTKLENGVCVAHPTSPIVVVTEVSKGIFDSSSTVSKIFTMGRSLSVGLGLIAKIIQNVRFLDIDYPREVLNAFETYGTDLFELPIPEFFYESPETKEIPSQYSRYDVNATFLENYWQTIMMILITLTLFLMIRLIQYLTRHQNKENIYQICLKNIGQTIANFFTIQIYSSLDDVIFFFVLDVGSTKMSSASAGISMSIAGLFLLIGGFLVIFHCWVLGKYQQAKRQGQLEKFEEKFRIVGTLFEEFKDDSPIKQSFFGILILRCVFLVLVILLLQPPWIQASLLMGANLIFLGYLIYQRPFKSKLDEFSQYFCEFCVFAAYLSAMILSIFDYREEGTSTTRNGFGKCIVISGIVLCLGGFILQMIQTVGAIIEIIKFFRNYYRKTQVTPASDEVNQDSESSNIMKTSGIDLVELIKTSHKNQNKITSIALEKLQCSEVSFANNDNPPILEKTSKREISTEITEFEALRTQGSGQASQLIFNVDSEILPQMNGNRKHKKFKKKQRQPNLSVLHDHHHVNT